MACFKFMGVGEGQEGKNITNLTKIERRGSPCLSGSNTFCNRIVMTIELSICKPRVRTSTTAQKRKTKQRKRSRVSTVQTNASIWLRFHTMLLLLTSDASFPRILQRTVYRFLIGRKTEPNYPKPIRRERYVRRSCRSFQPERPVQGEGP